MKNIWKRILTVAISTSLVFGSCVPAFAQETSDASDTTEVTVDEGDKPYIALGADLSQDELSTVLSLMGLTTSDLEAYDVVYVTNEQEHEYLDSYIDSSTIGTRALSSVVVMQGESGSGITVTTKNISYCTAGMYENALATAGIEDAEVIVAGPFSISGTAALIGAIEAYSVMTGEEIDEEVIDGAIEEIVVTGAIEEATGSTEEVEGMVAYLKEQLAESEDLSDAELEDLIEEAAKKFDVSLSQDEIDQLLSLLKKLQGMNLNWSNIADQAQSVYDKLSNMGFDISSIDTEKLASEASGIIAKIIAFIKSFFK